MSCVTARADFGSLVFLEQRVSIGATTMRHELVPAEKGASRIQKCRLLVSQPAGS